MATTPGILKDLVQYVRARMAQVGLLGVPIVYNEFGWPTSGYRPFDHWRALAPRQVHRAGRATFAARSDCGVVSIAPYAWATSQELPEDTEDWYGIVGHPSAPCPIGRHVSTLGSRACFAA